MAAASSGRHRQEAMAARADDLDAQARQLASKATALREAADSVRKGNEGEMLVGERLDVLDGAGWRVLHDRRKNATSPSNLDHVVVGPSGIFVIDSKNWSGGVLRPDERGMKLGSRRKDDALHAAKVDAELVQWIARRAVPDVHAVGVLAFVQDVGLIEPRDHRDVLLTQEQHLLPWLTGRPQVLSAEQVETLSGLLDRELPPRHNPNRRGSPARSSSTSRQVRPHGKSGSLSRRRRAEVGRDLRRGLIKMAVLGAVVVTLPATMPVLQDYVLQPLAERMADSFAPPAPVPAPPQPVAPAS